MNANKSENILSKDSESISSAYDKKSEDKNSINYNNYNTCSFSKKEKNK